MVCPRKLVWLALTATLCLAAEEVQSSTTAAETEAAAAADTVVSPPPPPPAAPPVPVPLIASLLLPLLIAAYFFFRGSGGARGSRVVLFGPQGSGKTTLYLQLRYGHTSPTFTSMQMSSATFLPACKLPEGSGPARAITVVDCPGTERLLPTLLNELPGSAVLVCVLDATQLTTQARLAAGPLYDVLAHEAVQRQSTPIVFACNHSDAKGAGATAVAQKLIESELTQVRKSRTTMQDIAGRTVTGPLADASGGPFTFDQLRNEVQFVSCSATKPSLDSLLQFVLKRVR